MPRQKREQDDDVTDIFNLQMIQSTVRDFCIFYIRNRDKVKTTNQEKSNISFDEAFPSGRMLEEVKPRKSWTIIRKEEGVQTRPSMSLTDSIRYRQAQMGGGFVDVEDKRFSKLDELVRKCVSGTKYKPEEREIAQNELWELILTLKIEHRVPEFDMQPFRDKQLSDIKEKYALLEGRVDIANSVSQRVWKEWEKFKATLPKGTRDLLTE